MKRYNLPMAASALLPHSSPMLSVDQLLDWDKDRAVALLTIKEPALLASTPTPLEFYIEIIAQTAALHNGYEALCQGKEPPAGMLVGAEKFRFESSFTLGEELQVEITKGFAFGAINFIEGRVLRGDKIYATGTIKVWVESEN